MFGLGGAIDRMSSSRMEKASTPQAVGRTTIPKVPLSYRWVISDAELLLKNCDPHNGLRGPKFSTKLPLKTTAEWELVIMRNPSKVGSYSLYLHSQQLSHGGQQQFSGGLQLGGGLLGGGVSLGSSTKVRTTTKLLISSCKFSILSSSTSMSKLTTTLPTTQFEVGQPLETFGKQDFITNLNDYLDDGMLTIQIDAMLHCLTHPAKTVDQTCNVPEDSIREAIKTLYNDGDNSYCDLTIKCADETFRAHKVILASQSPVFKKMFEIDMTEKRSDTVEISDLDSKVLSNLLAYLYTGDCPDLSSLAKELMNVANKYQLPRLIALCEKELESRVIAKNVLELLVLADLHQASHLKAVCMKFIKFNSADVFQSEGWKNLKETCPIDCQGLLFELLEFSGTITQ